MGVLKHARRIAVGLIAGVSLVMSAHAGELVQCSHAGVADIAISLGICDLPSGVPTGLH